MVLYIFRCPDLLVATILIEIKIAVHIPSFLSANFSCFYVSNLDYHRYRVTYTQILHGYGYCLEHLGPPEHLYLYLNHLPRKIMITHTNSCTRAHIHILTYMYMYTHTHIGVDTSFKVRGAW